MAPKNLRPIEESDGDLACYLCGNPADQVKTMKTPSGGQYLRGWCLDCLAGGTPKKKRKAAYVKAAAAASKDRSFAVGQKVEIILRGKVMTYLPRGRGVEVLVGRRVVLIDERDLVSFVADFDDQVDALVDLEIERRKGK